LDATISQDQIPSVYNSLSKTYDIWGRLAETRARTRALELAAIKDGQKILEVAVGTGLAFCEVVKSNSNGTNIGIDISKGMLDKAEQKLSQLPGANYELKIESAFNIQAENNHFDLLINCYMFDLIAFDEMDPVLSEFRRVLKGNGKLILVNMTEGLSFVSGVYNLIYRISPKSFGGCRAVKLSEKLKKNGFKVHTREYHQQLFFPSEVILARKE
jgi:ubiquinone/menaquinone biosynthesis C-methylase UbiE